MGNLLFELKKLDDLGKELSVIKYDNGNFQFEGKQVFGEAFIGADNNNILEFLEKMTPEYKEAIKALK
jgi:hypothetical protein